MKIELMNRKGNEDLNLKQWNVNKFLAIYIYLSSLSKSKTVECKYHRASSKVGGRENLNLKQWNVNSNFRVHKTYLYRI